MRVDVVLRLASDNDYRLSKKSNKNKSKCNAMVSSLCSCGLYILSFAFRVLVHAAGLVVHGRFVKSVSIWMSEDSFPIWFPSIGIDPLLEVWSDGAFKHMIGRPIQKLLKRDPLSVVQGHERLNRRVVYTACKI